MFELYMHPEWPAFMLITSMCNWMAESGFTTDGSSVRRREQSQVKPAMMLTWYEVVIES